MRDTQQHADDSTSVNHTRAVLAAAALAFILSPSIASAQNQTMAEIVSFLLTNRSIVTDDFQRDEAAAIATRDGLARALQIELATLPISSSSAGFTYRFNPALGTTARASDSFGPFYVERALTAGAGRASLGFSMRYAKFDDLDGTNLRDGSFVTTANTFTDEPAPFDLEALTLRIDTTAFTAFGTVGLTDRFDLGFAVPIIALDVDGERFNTFRGQSTLQARASASVVGLADVAVRAKYYVAGERGSGLAAGFELRLPTGNEEDLLGAGKAAYKGLVIGSVEGTTAAAHFNLSYGAGGISDEVTYAAGVTAAVAPRLTLSGELVGRWIEALGQLQPVTIPHPTIRGVNTIRLVSEEGGTQSAFVVAGFKWNVGSAWLLTGHLLVPVTDGGLRAKVVPAFALDYAFGR